MISSSQESPGLIMVPGIFLLDLEGIVMTKPALQQRKVFVLQLHLHLYNVSQKTTDILSFSEHKVI